MRETLHNAWLLALRDSDSDAIHDTVHEMAKDEARHGRGFDGLLARYFAE